MILRILGFFSSSSGIHIIPSYTPIAPPRTHRVWLDIFGDICVDVFGFEDLMKLAASGWHFCWFVLAFKVVAGLPKIVPTIETTSRITPHQKYQFIFLQYNNLTKKTGVFKDQQRLMSNEVVASLDKKQFVKKLVSSSLVFALFFPREQKINKNHATTHTKQGSTCYQPKYCSMYKGKSIRITIHFRPSPKFVVISTRLQGGPLPVINGVIIPDTHL